VSGAAGRDAWFTTGLAAVITAGAMAVGAALGAGPGAAAGAVVGLASSGVLVRRGRARARRRARALAEPFPDAWRRVLEERYDHYSRLPAAERARFESHVQLFLAEKRVTGVEVEATAELKLLVAASAATLTAGWPAFEWEALAEVLLYPQDFDRDYSFDESELSGQAHPWGTLILSVPSLEESFDDPDDGYHVALHEFAHLLDVDQTRFDGVPAGFDEERSRTWLALVEKELERLRRGKSALDPYAGEDPMEFLAVAVETFFERPLALRRRHAEVYATLRDYFGQDPAAWDEARGLEEY
jgi:Mlc titration factor MtfA (ptsG expression regulator)